MEFVDRLQCPIFCLALAYFFPAPLRCDIKAEGGFLGRHAHQSILFCEMQTITVAAAVQPTRLDQTRLGLIRVQSLPPIPYLTVHAHGQLLMNLHYHWSTPFWWGACLPFWLPAGRGRPSASASASVRPMRPSVTQSSRQSHCRCYCCCCWRSRSSPSRFACKQFVC